MAKVKKETGVTGERNAKGKSGRKKGNGKSRTVQPRTRKQVEARKGTAKRGKKGVKTARKQARKTTAGAKKAGKLALVRGRVAEPPVVRVAVKPLDPLRKCGPNTTVQFLYRVDEQVDGRSTPHLVFFDRHGWYCEHGRTCPAVGHARKFNGQIARVS